MKRVPRVHIIHVGSVQNKGTHALLRSEVSEIRRICDNVEISVSTDDVEALEHLEPDLSVYPGIIDIPYARADVALRRGGRMRRLLAYRASVLCCSLLMLFQVFLATICALCMSIGIETGYRAETLSRIRGCDLVISTADENFKEGSLYMPLNLYWMLTWWTILFSRMMEILIIKRLLRRHVVVFPNSIGPFHTRVGLVLARIIFENVDLVMLREPHSYDLFKKLNVKTASLLTTDIALLLQSLESKCGRSLPTHAVGVCPALYSLSFSDDQVRRYISGHAYVLDCLVEKYGYSIIFLPHEVSPVKAYDDLELSRRIVREMRHSASAEIIETSSVDEFKCCLSQLDFLISSRMHPAVLACADRVPTLMLIYDHKQAGFFAQLGLGAYTLPIVDITQGRLLNKVKLVLSDRDMLRTQLQLRVPILQSDLQEKMRKVMLRISRGVVQE